MTANQEGGFLSNATVSTFFGCEAMQRLFDTQSQFQAWLDVEAALARAQASLGLIPPEAAKRITQCARIDQLNAAEIAALTVSTGHPLVPLIRALAERCGAQSGDHVHLGATTQDIMDTGFVLQARAGLELVMEQLSELAAVLRRLAAQHRTTVMAGRTHGQQALPTTFGLRLAGWYEEVMRHRARLQEMRARLLVGSFGGAVGTMAGYGPRALELRRAVMQELELGEPGASWHANQ
ncbi:MAG: lyase family protein, partial [Alphaproteobacteria bacterium]|nr:lyase family protein [Alphaproteobacteria bacterium]